MKYSYRPQGFCTLVARAGMIALALAAAPAAAQRASEDVVASAEDAFGTTIGHESIGLYTSTEARGFSPKDAGNFRLEGLYFDQVKHFGYTNQLVRSTNIRVGLTAQSYPFPAPTGIVDIRLRLPGNKILKSFNAEYGSFDRVGGQVDFEMPRDGKRPGLFMSAAAANRALGFPKRINTVDASGLLHWKPNETLELIVFAQHTVSWDGENLPYIFTAGAYLPPRITRKGFFGQSFTQGWGRTRENDGIIARGAVSDNWRLEAGVFRSGTSLKNNFSFLYLDTQPNGIGNVSIRSQPTTHQSSYSGEIRVSRLFREGNRRHTVYFSAKGRAAQRTFGGDDTIELGPALIGDTVSIPKPTLNFGPLSEDTVRYGALAISYVGMWPGVGEVSAGLQKGFCRRTLDHPLRPNTTTRAHPWLYNGTLAVHASDNLTFYVGYTRGLEDSAIAPENATNPGEPVAATLTRQVDAGLRYRLSASMTLVAGVFEVEKPYFDRDGTGFFSQVGRLSHRGIKLSLSGEPVQGLKIVVGAVFLKARVSGSTVDQGLIAEVPPGRPSAEAQLNANYGPTAWHGFSINGHLKFKGAHYANRLDTVRIPSLTTLDLGTRYDFKIHAATVSMRLDVKNVTDAYEWTVNAVSGHYIVSQPRQYTLRLFADS